MRATRLLAAAGALAAAALTAHTAVNVTRLRRPERPETSVPETISVLLPARDEESRITGTVVSVLEQRGVDDLELVVLDDASTDRTSTVVTAAAAGDPRLTLVQGTEEPPPGWLGKPWACARLAGHARGTVLVFVDADVTLTPDAIASAVNTMRGNGFDLISPYPRQEAHGLVPRLVQPLLEWSWLTTLPLGVAERSRRPSLSAANGQFLVVDAAAYRRIGGHAAVRGQVLEDIALMRAMKAAGRRATVIDGSPIASCRMYESAGELYHGYTKSLWAAFGSGPGATAVMALLVGTYVLPPVLALVTRDRATRLLGATAYGAAVVGRVMVARRTRQRVWPDVMAHPASVASLAALTAASFARHARGDLTWKGRAVA